MAKNPFYFAPEATPTPLKAPGSTTNTAAAQAVTASALAQKVAASTQGNRPLSGPRPTDPNAPTAMPIMAGPYADNPLNFSTSIPLSAERQIALPVTNTPDELPIGVSPGMAAPTGVPLTNLDVVNQLKGLTFQTIVVPVGQSITVNQRGNYVYVEGIVYNSAASYNYGISETTPTLKSDTTNSVYPLYSNNREIGFPEPFNWILVSNQNGNVAITVRLWIGFGSIRRDVARSLREANQAFAFSNIAYAANKNVGAGPVVFQEISSPNNQRGRIKKATAFISGSAVVTAADFTLWLVPYYPAAIADNATFVFPTSLSAGSFATGGWPTQVRFASFITGGAGSAGSYSEISELDIEFFTSNTLVTGTGTDYPYSLAGLLIANGAWTPGATGSISVTLTCEKG